MQPRVLGILECAAASAAQTKLRATEGAQLRLKTNVRRNGTKGKSLETLGTILDRFYTGFLARDAGYIAFGSLPWQLTGSFDYSYEETSIIGGFVIFSFWILVFYLTGLFLTELLTLLKIVKSNPEHGYSTSWLKWFEESIARGETTISDDLKQHYYARQIQLEKAGYPLNTLSRIVFLKHIMGIFGSCLLGSLILGLGSSCWLGPVGINYVLCFILPFVSFALNWYFWRFQFRTVDRLWLDHSLNDSPSPTLQ